MCKLIRCFYHKIQSLLIKIKFNVRISIIFYWLSHLSGSWRIFSRKKFGSFESIVFKTFSNLFHCLEVCMSQVIGATGTDGNSTGLGISRMKENFPAQRIDIFRLLCGMWPSIVVLQITCLVPSTWFLLLQWIIVQKDELPLVMLCSNSLNKIQQLIHQYTTLFISYPGTQHNFSGMNIELRSRWLAGIYLRFSAYFRVVI